MTRGASQRINDILEAIGRCEAYAAELSSPDPTQVRMAEDAIERNLQIIGEAAKRLPSEVTGKHPEIPWAQIRGFRNILVHEYFGVETEVVRDVVENYLPPLASALAKETRD